MNESDFHIKIESVDEELARKEIPIHARSLQAFHLISPDYNGPLLGYGIKPENYESFVGPNLLKHIDDWYEKRYGERSYIRATRGHVPVLIRKEVYLIRIPTVYGKVNVSILPLVEGLTEEMAKSLNCIELDEIKKAFEIGYALTHEIEDLRINIPSKALSLNIENLTILQRAIEDRDTAIRCLSGSLDNNGACFHAQQHAEKMLKSYLLVKNICTVNTLSRRPYGHNIEKIFIVCLNTTNNFSPLTNDIALLKNISMDIRYTIPKVAPEIAVKTVWAALRVGGLCACQISGHKRRHKDN
ncbi:MAG: hypothetical protein B6D35_09225 [Candidatus Brocadia sp. UTAMX2]|jgi:HEPN domain-containing protein|nr:MAG: hypothetical protein B6D35_09225 [Candidatus Brocadia sp. UTAMX2]